MGKLIILSMLMGFMFAQEPGDPANPFPGHEEPVPGWFCTPAANQQAVEEDAHACSCLGMQKDPVCTKPNPDMPGFDMPVSNDSADCKVYCHKDHCHCQAQCDTLNSK